MTESATPPKRPSRIRRLLRYAGIILLLLIVVAFIARRHIGNMLAEQLNQRLAAAGIHLDWSAADFVPGPGIQVRDLALYRDASKRERIALLSKLKVFKGDAGWSQWNAVSVRIDDSRLTLGHDDLETHFDDLHLSLNIRPGAITLQKFHTTLQGLRLEATAHHVPSSRSEAPAPKSEKPLESLDLGWLKPLKSWVQVEPGDNAPVLRVDYQSTDDGSAAKVTATLDGHGFGWRGQQWDSMQAAVHTTLGDPPSPVEIPSLHIGHNGKSTDITASYDPATGVLQVARCKSFVDLLVLASAFSSDPGAGLAGITARGDWKLNGSGPIGIKTPDASNWQGSLGLVGELTYAKDKTLVTFKNPECGVTLVGPVLTVSEFKAGLWDGNLSLPSTRIDLPTAEKKPRFDTSVRLDGARLESIATSFGSSQKQPGTLRMDWTGGGGFTLPTIEGGGSLAIEDAEFFRIPLLGPLHLIFDQITPGFGKDVASGLTCRHSLADSKLDIRDLHLDSKLTRIDANGVINLQTNHAHLKAQAQLQGLLGKAASLLSSLLEVEGIGPMNDMKWRPTNLPDGETLSNAAKSVGKAGESVIDGTGKAIKSTGDAVKKLFTTPSKLLPRK